MLAVVFPPFAQRLENSVSRGCWHGSMTARSFPQFPRPLLLQPTIWTSERGADLGSGKCQPRPHLPIYRMTLLYLLAPDRDFALRSKSSREESSAVGFFDVSAESGISLGGG